MTVESLSNRVTYTADGLTTVFPYTYRILDQADLVVTTELNGLTTLLVITTNYTVSGVLSYTGGNVTLLATPVAGTVVTISRVPAELQETSLQSQGQYDAKVVETMADLLTMQVQALQTQVDDLEATPPEIAWRDGQNAIINGDGRVAQRAAYAATVSATRGYGKCDKWKGCIVGNAGLVGSLTQATGLSFGRTGYGVKWSAMTIAGAAEAVFFQFIEAKDCGIFYGGEMTGSVWVYQDSGSDATVSVTVYYASAVDNFASVAAFSLTVSATVPSGIPTLVSLPVVTAPAGVLNGLQFTVDCVFAGAVTNKNLTITDAILHPGSSEMDYTPDPIEVAFAKCQRFFAKTYDSTVAPGTVSTPGLIRSVAYDNTSLYGGNWRFPVTMRAAPTVTLYSPGTGTSGKIQDVTAAADVNGTAAFIGTSGAQGQGPGTLTATNLCQFHATADADF